MMVTHRLSGPRVVSPPINSTLNCFANTLNLDLAVLNKILKSKHQLVIDGGYGKLKGKTFRISNMGDETDETIAAMLKSLDAAMAETPKSAG